MADEQNESFDECELQNDRRMTRVLSPDEIQFLQEGNETFLAPSPTNSYSGSPRPVSLYKQVGGMTQEQVQELLHKLNITDDDSSHDESGESGKEKVNEQMEEKTQAKTQKKKAPPKKATKGNNKNIKIEKQADQEEPTPPVQDSGPEETKAKKAKRGKKDNTVTENVTEPMPNCSNMKPHIMNKELVEEMAIESKPNKQKKTAKGKQNDAKEIITDSQSEDKKNSDGNNENMEKISENDSKTKKLKKTKSTEDADIEGKKTLAKKQNSKLLTKENNDEKEPVKPTKKGKAQDLAIKEEENNKTTTSGPVNAGENKSSRPTRGKQKDNATVLKEINEPELKQSASKIDEEISTGRPKRNNKKETQEVTDKVVNEANNEVVRKSKKKGTDLKLNVADVPKVAPKNMSLLKSNQPKEKKLSENEENKESREEAPPTKRAPRKVVKH